MKRRSPVIDNWALRVFLQTNPHKDHSVITALNGYLFMYWIVNMTLHLRLRSYALA